ncbi:MAG: corrinoid protein [Firmicutes bacterium]|nr:corrinoid protein [Bacillota bacterium]
MQILEDLKQNLIAGKKQIVCDKCNEAIAAGIKPGTILDALLDGMSVVGVRFKSNEIFVPEVLIAARALNAALVILKPLLVAEGVEPIGKAVIGTVKGDLHDIGKNLVKMMLVGAGFDVIDAGVDVAPDKFAEVAEAEGADIICLSALLTTTMESMRDTIEYLKAKNIRDKYIVMIGGAPITDAFCKEIGADAYTADAASAAETAKALLKKKK